MSNQKIRKERINYDFIMKQIEDLKNEAENFEDDVCKIMLNTLEELEMRILDKYYEKL